MTSDLVLYPTQPADDPNARLHQLYLDYLEAAEQYDRELRQNPEQEGQDFYINIVMIGLFILIFIYAGSSLMRHPEHLVDALFSTFLVMLGLFLIPAVIYVGMLYNSMNRHEVKARKARIAALTSNRPAFNEFYQEWKLQAPPERLLAVLERTLSSENNDA